MNPRYSSNRAAWWMTLVLAQAAAVGFLAGIWVGDNRWTHTAWVALAYIPVVHLTEWLRPRPEPAPF